MKTNMLVFACLLAATAIAIASPAPPIFQIRLVLDTASADTEPMTYITHNQHHSYTNVLYVQKTVLLDQTALQSAKPGKNGLGQPTIWITFTGKGAKEFADVTRQNIHRRLAIIINGQVCEAPIIQMEIPGGEAHIDGAFSKQEVKDLAKKINVALAQK